MERITWLVVVALFRMNSYNITGNSIFEMTMIPHITYYCFSFFHFSKAKILCQKLVEANASVSHNNWI